MIQRAPKMRLATLGGTAAQKLGACLFALATALAGCASRPLVDPPSPELRQRMDRVIMRVFAESKPGAHAVDELLVGAEDGASYAAKNVATAGAKTGLYIFAGSCHPGWGVLWFLTCPYGAAAGLAVGVGTAMVGGAGGAVYGAMQARTQDEIDTAVATLDKALSDMRLGADFLDQIISATRKKTTARIIDDERREGAAPPDFQDEIFPIIVLTKIDDFTIVREGRLTPSLSLRVSVSADLFDAPEAGRRYTRSWSFSSTLGGFYAQTEQNGAGFRREINAALETLATAIVEDVFLSVESVPPNSGRAIEGTVVTLIGGESPSTLEWFREQKQKADCGDVEAQAALGKAYAAIEPRIYGRRARLALIEGYHWLRRAEMSGHGDTETASYLAKLRKHLEPGDIEETERRAEEWLPANCGPKSTSTASSGGLADPPAHTDS